MCKHKLFGAQLNLKNSNLGHKAISELHYIKTILKLSLRDKQVFLFDLSLKLTKKKKFSGAKVN